MMRCRCASMAIDFVPAHTLTPTRTLSHTHTRTLSLPHTHTHTDKALPLLNVMTIDYVLI